MAAPNQSNLFGDPDSESLRDGRQHPIAFGGEDATLNPFAFPTPTEDTQHIPRQTDAYSSPSQQQQPPPSEYVNDLIDLQQSHSPTTSSNPAHHDVLTGTASYPPPLHQATSTSVSQQTVIGRQPPPLSANTSTYAPHAPLKRVETFQTDAGTASFLADEFVANAKLISFIHYSVSV